MPKQANFASLDGLHTFPRLLFHHAKTRPNAPAMREKYLGIWQTWTWSDVAERVRALACALAELGFKRGDNLAVIGDNRPHLYMMMTAAQCLGGVPVPLYQDAVANEMLFALQDAGIRFAIVEDQEQVDKMLEIKDQTGALEHIIYDDPRGMRHYNQSFLHDIHELMEMGRIHDRNHPDFLNTEIELGHYDDISVMLYTSGTTGKPKGVCQTHGSFIAAAQGGVQVDNLGADGDILSYLPMAWVGDHLFSYAQALVAGFTINCPESGETVMTDLREIGPTCYFAPPRVFESLLTSVMIRMEDAGQIKQKVFHHFMAVAKRCGADILDGKSVGFGDRFQYWLGNVLIYAPLRNVLGMSRIRVAYTAGAAIGPELFRFYRSMGINLKQFYGQTETCAYVCIQPDGQIKFDSVGQPAPRRRNQDCRQRRGAGQGTNAVEGILQAAGCHCRVDQCRGLFHDR
jgi:long-chain acyl-CoA synthetase